MAKNAPLTTGPIGDAPDHMRAEGAGGYTTADAQVAEVTPIDMGPEPSAEDAAPKGHSNMPGRTKLSSGRTNPPIVVSREDRLRKRVPGEAAPRPEPVQTPALVAQAAPPLPPPPPPPEPVDPAVLELLGGGSRQVESTSLVQATQEVRQGKIQAQLRPPEIAWGETRAPLTPVIEVVPSVALLHAYADALAEGSAGQVFVGGYGSRLESWLHGLISHLPDRRCQRVPRLTAYVKGEARQYVWTGWGILYQGRWRLVVWEVAMDPVRPVTALLCDPQGLF